MADYTIQLPKFHPAQQKLYSELKKYNAVAWGRRAGKTTFAENWDIEPMLAGYPVAWFSASYQYIKGPWRHFKQLLAPLISYKNETDRYIELVTGGSLKCWSLENPDAGRGERYKRLVVDEASLVRHLEVSWNGSIEPTLTDYNGEALLCFTPKGRNYAHTLFQKGQDPSEPDWHSSRLPSSCNPKLPKGFLEEKRRNLPTWAYQQEYEASFDAIIGAIFRREFFANSYVDEVPVAAERVRAWDKALGQDWTVGALLAKTPDGLFWVEDVVRGQWSINERDKIMLATAQMDAARYQNRVKILIEQEPGSGGMESALASIKLLAGYNAKAKTMSGSGSKVERAAPFASQCEAGNVKLKKAPWNEAFISELADFTIDDSHPHDDQVDASSLAFNQLALHAKRPLKIY